MLIQIVLRKERETKRTIVFKSEDEEASIDTLYIKKTAFRGGVPEEITVSVSEYGE